MKSTDEVDRQQPGGRRASRRVHRECSLEGLVADIAALAVGEILEQGLVDRRDGGTGRLLGNGAGLSGPI